MSLFVVINTRTHKIFFTKIKRTLEKQKKKGFKKYIFYKKKMQSGKFQSRGEEDFTKFFFFFVIVCIQLLVVIELELLLISITSVSFNDETERRLFVVVVVVS